MVKTARLTIVESTGRGLESIGFERLVSTHRQG